MGISQEFLVHVIGEDNSSRAYQGRPALNCPGPGTEPFVQLGRAPKTFGNLVQIKPDVRQDSAFAPCPCLFADSLVTADEAGVEMQASSLMRVPNTTPVFSAAPLPCLALARDTLASLKAPTWKGQALPVGCTTQRRRLCYLYEASWQHNYVV